MGEFSEGKMLCPGSGIGATEDPKVSFHFLVDPFCFSVGLRVVAVERVSSYPRSFPSSLAKVEAN